MEVNSVVKGENILKKFKGFELSVPQLRIPKGYATALIGENGAGKTTLLNLLTGIRLDFKGVIRYFDKEEKLSGSVQERIGYTGPGNYFLPHWTIWQVEEVSEVLFQNFHKDRFREICEELNIPVKAAKEVKNLSDGNRIKLMLAVVLARDTELLVLDEPASPLDPLMRDRLCDILRDYLEKGGGEHSVFFSTHNISDMENVTDYVIILEQGKIVEEGFTEELKEKYVSVKGEAGDAAAAEKILFTMSKSAYGFEGICLAENMDQLAGLDISVETPTLSQISVAVMKAHTKLR
ncbi:MAG: ABC transporter ATP-binding protein [Roseburia sp.]|nr:ABC transporter ATP-binding protein [Roseburia sp.]MCM1098115.1 ABC transporter ATP-binding protein [Ruminococcus flavefaciens]